MLISANDIELSHDNLKAFYDAKESSKFTEEDNDDDDDDEFDEETRFVHKNHSSFYTSSERTWDSTSSMKRHEVKL